MRLIDADALHNEIDRVQMVDRVVRKTGAISVSTIRAVIENQNTVDAVPVRHGRWIYDADYYYFECSVCGTIQRIQTVNGKPDANYCPNCGARMDGGSDDV